MGHEGRDPGEYDPLGVYAYAFDRTERVWRRSVLHAGGNVGFGLDPKVVDLDGDGDLDLICSARSGLYWLENLHIDGRREETAPPPATLPDAALASGDNTRLLVVRDEAGREQPVKTPLDWGRRRGKSHADMEAAMGDLPDSSRRVPLDVKIVDEAAAVGYRRIRLTYAAEEGDRVPAYLLIPEGLKAKAPALLCLHPTNPKGKDQLVGASGESAPAYADELARRGYVCLVPDYPGFGEYAYDFQKTGKHYASGSMKAVWNNIRAIDLLEALPEVNGDRIGCVGHSLGGHNGLFTAAFDQRIAAVVTSCGFTALADYHGGRLDGWASDRYMPRVRAIYGGDASRMPFDFHEVLGALAPRPVYVVAPRGDEPFLKSGVEKVVAEARTVYALRGAEGALVADYPHGGHGFSDEARRAAYAWLDGQLKK
jgi:dienelactone hydrolase